MDNVYLYRIKLPHRVKECILSCAEGYTFYIDADLDDKTAPEVYKHALMHIKYCGFDMPDVQQIEYDRHKLQN